MLHYFLPSISQPLPSMLFCSSYIPYIASSKPILHVTQAQDSEGVRIVRGSKGTFMSSLPISHIQHELLLPLDSTTWLNSGA